MPKITFIEHNGERHTIEAALGSSLMQAAVDNHIPGIIGECGGNCSCATCQVYVAPQCEDSLRPMRADEESLLEITANRRPNSRLSCQIFVNPQLEGLVLELPVSQS